LYHFMRPFWGGASTTCSYAFQSPDFDPFLI
jgi:hypothetical protein